MPGRYTRHRPEADARHPVAADERLALGPGTFADRCRLILGFGAGNVFSLAGLQFLEPEFQLLDLAADPLRRPAKLHSPQLGDLELQLLDLQRLELHRRLCRLQLALTGQREGTQFGGAVASDMR